MKRGRLKSEDEGVLPGERSFIFPLPPLVFALLLLAVALLAYFPAWNGKPIWDDDAHLTKPELRSLGGLERIWTEPGATQQYYPLVHTVFWIEHRLFGDSTLPYHLFNILLHVAAALLFLRVLVQLKVPGAWLAGAVFALHPIQVESVAWISELKNTLSALFFFSALLFYLRFDQSRRRPVYILALALFGLGLLCKTTIAPLPAVLLVIFWWLRAKLSLKRDLLPLVPFFILGIGAGLFTAWVEHRFIGAHGEAFHLGLIERCLIAGRAFWFYLFKLFWPANLIFIYPRWEVSALLWWQYLFPLAALLLFAIAFTWRKRSRAPLAAMLIFAGMLFPALGFINVYPFIYSFVADHFQYLASAAAITLAAASITLLFDRFNLRPTIRYATLLALLTLLATLSWHQARIYRDPETLYRSTLQQNPACWLAENNLGGILLGRGDVTEAAGYLEKTVEINPNYAVAHNNLANALGKMGQVDAAIVQYKKALEIKPDYAAPHTNLGGLLLQINRVEESHAELQKALEIDPKDPDAHTNIGNALLEMGRIDEAIHHYEKAVELRSYNSRTERAKADYNLAFALARNGQLDDAIFHYQRALEFQPNYADAHNNLGRALLAKDQISDALMHYERAVALAPQSVLYQNNLAWQFATCSDVRLRNGTKAVALAERANQLSGGKDPLILNTLAAAYAQDRQFSKAIETAKEALRLAESGSDPALINVLRRALTLYQDGSPYKAALP